MAERSSGALWAGFIIEPPFGFRSADGGVGGCDVELLRLVAETLGYAGLEPVETRFEALLSGLAEDRWDVTVGLFVTPERARRVDFCRPVWALGDGLLVRSGDSSAIDGYGSIARDGRLRVAAIKDQVQHHTALACGVPPDRILLFDGYEQAAGAVREGEADAYASVAMAHRGYLRGVGDDRLAVVEVPAAERSPAPGAFAVAKERIELRQQIDGALSRLLGSPAHRALMAAAGFAPHEAAPFD